MKKRIIEVSAVAVIAIAAVAIFLSTRGAKASCSCRGNFL